VERSRHPAVSVKSAAAPDIAADKYLLIGVI
jgi:hypothetical protein